MSFWGFIAGFVAVLGQELFKKGGFEALKSTKHQKKSGSTKPKMLALSSREFLDNVLEMKQGKQIKEAKTKKVMRKVIEKQHKRVQRAEREQQYRRESSLHRQSKTPQRSQSRTRKTVDKKSGIHKKEALKKANQVKQQKVQTLMQTRKKILEAKKNKIAKINKTN